MNETAEQNGGAPAEVIGRVQEVLDAIRPSIQADGGDIEFIAMSADGIVEIRMLGACVNCPSSTMTLKVGIEENLKKLVPEVCEVLAIE